uniref:Uncharacterized protein n=1 Tax=Anguilla anguilla TaxID=7936 RepID=A0A0E9RIW2_ANGAN
MAPLTRILNKTGCTFQHNTTHFLHSLLDLYRLKQVAGVNFTALSTSVH